MLNKKQTIKKFENCKGPVYEVYPILALDQYENQKKSKIYSLNLNSKVSNFVTSQNSNVVQNQSPEAVDTNKLFKSKSKGLELHLKSQKKQKYIQTFGRACAPLAKLNESRGKKFLTSYSKLTEIQLVTVGLASPKRIQQWAEKTLPNGKIIGQVLNANTLHHKTFKPQKGGLFCERIFGPLKDFVCSCNKTATTTISKYLTKPNLLKFLETSSFQKKSREASLEDQNISLIFGASASKGTPNIPSVNEAKSQKTILSKRFFCPKCDVEYTWSVIRRYQLGYIQLISPVAHVWYLKGNPSYLSILFDMKKRQLEYVNYCSETLTLEYSLKENDFWSQSLKGYSKLFGQNPNELLLSWKNLFNDNNINNGIVNDRFYETTKQTNTTVDMLNSRTHGIHFSSLKENLSDGQVPSYNKRLNSSISTIKLTLFNKPILNKKKKRLSKKMANLTNKSMPKGVHASVLQSLDTRVSTRGPLNNLIGGMPDGSLINTQVLYDQNLVGGMLNGSLNEPLRASLIIKANSNFKKYIYFNILDEAEREASSFKIQTLQCKFKPSPQATSKKKSFLIQKIENNTKVEALAPRTYNVFDKILKDGIDTHVYHKLGALTTKAPALGLKSQDLAFQHFQKESKLDTLILNVARSPFILFSKKIQLSQNLFFNKTVSLNKILYKKMPVYFYIFMHLSSTPYKIKISIKNFTHFFFNRLSLPLEYCLKNELSNSTLKTQKLKSTNFDFIPLTSALTRSLVPSFKNSQKKDDEMIGLKKSQLHPKTQIKIVSPKKSGNNLLMNFTNQAKETVLGPSLRDISSPGLPYTRDTLTDLDNLKRFNSYYLNETFKKLFIDLINLQLLKIKEKMNFYSLKRRLYEKKRLDPSVRALTTLNLDPSSSSVLFSSTINNVKYESEKTLIQYLLKEKNWSLDTNVSTNNFLKGSSNFNFTKNLKKGIQQNFILKDFYLSNYWFIYFQKNLIPMMDTVFYSNEFIKGLLKKKDIKVIPGNRYDFVGMFLNNLREPKVDALNNFKRSSSIDIDIDHFSNSIVNTSIIYPYIEGSSNSIFLEKNQSFFYLYKKSLRQKINMRAYEKQFLFRWIAKKVNKRLIKLKQENTLFSYRSVVYKKQGPSPKAGALVAKAPFFFHRGIPLVSDDPKAGALGANDTSFILNDIGFKKQKDFIFLNNYNKSRQVLSTFIFNKQKQIQFFNTRTKNLSSFFYLLRHHFFASQKNHFLNKQTVITNVTNSLSENSLKDTLFFFYSKNLSFYQIELSFSSYAQFAKVQKQIEFDQKDAYLARGMPQDLVHAISLNNFIDRIPDGPSSKELVFKDPNFKKKQFRVAQYLLLKEIHFLAKVYNLSLSNYKKNFNSIKKNALIYSSLQKFSSYISAFSLGALEPTHLNLIGSANVPKLVGNDKKPLKALQPINGRKEFISSEVKKQGPYKINKGIPPYNISKGIRLNNNFYSLSHMQTWELEKDWLFFQNFSSALPFFTDIPIPAYINRFSIDLSKKVNFKKMTLSTLSIHSHTDLRLHNIENLFPPFIEISHNFGSLVRKGRASQTPQQDITLGTPATKYLNPGRHEVSILPSLRGIPPFKGILSSLRDIHPFKSLNNTSDLSLSSNFAARAYPTLEISSTNQLFQKIAKFSLFSQAFLTSACKQKQLCRKQIFNLTIETAKQQNPILDMTIALGENLFINASYSGAGLLQHLLKEYDLSELKKIDKQNRFLLYELNNQIFRLTKNSQFTFNELSKPSVDTLVSFNLDPRFLNSKSTRVSDDQNDLVQHRQYLDTNVSTPIIKADLVSKFGFLNTLTSSALVLGEKGLHYKDKYLKKKSTGLESKKIFKDKKNQLNSIKKQIKELYLIRDHFIRRTKLVRSFLKVDYLKKDSSPSSMILNILPVLPPDLRPIVKIGGQIAASDLNRLYQRVIYRNERLKKFLKDPATSQSYEMKYAQRLLQEAVDNLIQNGKTGTVPERDSRGRTLKSLSEILKGKQGRFRQYLLGKRVDYSGRSVIVVGPKLKLHQCGIPKEMALELFLPFLLKRILNEKLARTVAGAKNLIKTNKNLVWELLREVMQVTPVLLNRAPTLHRLGIQAFQPKLVDGRAILLHPLSCPAFNADFDGDQMAVHVPITVEARAEAWKLMLSRNNLLSPATGEPLVLPSQDMILGCYYLTIFNKLKYKLINNSSNITKSSIDENKLLQNSLTLSSNNLRVGELNTSALAIGSINNIKRDTTVPMPDFESQISKFFVSGSTTNPLVDKEALFASQWAVLSTKLSNFESSAYARHSEVDTLTSHALNNLKGPSLNSLLAKDSFFKEFSHSIISNNKFIKFNSIEDAMRAYENQIIDLHQPIWVKWNGSVEHGNNGLSFASKKQIDGFPIEIQVTSAGSWNTIYLHNITTLNGSWSLNMHTSVLDSLDTNSNSKNEFGQLVTLGSETTKLASKDPNMLTLLSSVQLSNESSKFKIQSSKLIKNFKNIYKFEFIQTSICTTPGRILFNLIVMKIV